MGGSTTRGRKAVGQAGGGRLGGATLLGWMLGVFTVLLCLGGCGEAGSLGVAAAPLCAGPKLTASASRVAVGDPVTLTTSNTACAVGESAEYRFLYRRDGTTGAYTELRAYGADASAILDTSALASGKYVVLVYVRAAGTSVTRDAYASATVLVGDVCPSTTLAVSPAKPLSVGGEATLTAAATCTGGVPEYRFSVLPAGATAYTELRGWGLATVASWSTVGLTAGAYTLKVDARASGNSSAYESQRTLAYSLGEKCTNVSATFSPAGQADPGVAVTLSATATCTNGAGADYQFKYRPVGASTYAVLRDWGGATAVWDTTALPVGSYQVQVLARANDTAGAAQSTRTYSYGVAGLCSAPTLAVTPKPPQLTGVPLTLTAGATCTSGTAEYRFLYRAAGASAYTEARGWDPSPTAVLATTELPSGYTVLRVDIRAVGTTVAYQATRSLGFNVGAVCSAVTAATSALPASPQPAGTPVTLTGQATCIGGATPEFRFLYRPAAASTFTELRGWGASSATWSTAGLAPGPYTFSVQSRGQGNLGAAESSRQLTYVLSAPCEAGFAPDLAGGCVDIDECAANNGGCDALTVCTNTAGSRTCGACPSGYAGTGETGCTVSPFGFFVMGDAQITASTSAKLSTAIGQMALIDPAPIAAFAVGDETEGGTDAQYGYYAGLVSPLFDVTADAFGGAPRFFGAVGNHDVLAASSWYASWTAHLPGQASLSAGSMYYSAAYEQALFVVRDTEHVTIPYATDVQTTDLAATLAAASQPFKFAFFHRPVYACNSTHAGFAGALPWLDLAEHHDVDVVFTGHTHVYSRTCRTRDAACTNSASGTVQVEVGSVAGTARSVNVASGSVSGTDAFGSGRADTYSCTSGTLFAATRGATNSFCYVRVEGCQATVSCYAVISGNTTPFDQWTLSHCE